MKSVAPARTPENVMSRYCLPLALLFAGALGLAQEKPLAIRAGVQPAAALSDDDALKQGKLDPTDGAQLVDT